MQILKKLILVTILLLVPTNVYAQLPFNQVAGNDPANFAFSNGTIADVVNAAFPILFALAGIVAFIYVLWAGFRILLSEGNAKTLETARKQLFQAIVGLVIIFASYWIIQLVEQILAVKIL